jgi:DNA-binding transcriptional MocR family regulator
LTDLKGNDDFGLPRLNQSLLQSVFDQGLYDAHVTEVRAAYRASWRMAVHQKRAHEISCGSA